MTEKAGRVEAGDRVHLLGALTVIFEGGLFGRSEVLGRGTTLALTSTLIELNQDGRSGRSIFDLAHDRDEQIRRWDKVRLAPGPWPDDQPTWVHGDLAWADARAAALADAWDIRDERKRDEALRRVRRLYGAAPTSKTLLTGRRTG